MAEAVTWIRAHFAQPVTVEEMAASVHMSASSFHQRFKAVTTMSPLQYQKVLRLHEARRLMLFQTHGRERRVPPRRLPECFAVQQGVRTFLRECAHQRYRPATRGRVRGRQR